MDEPLEFHIRRARTDDAEQVRLVQRSSVEALCAADYTAEQITAWTGFTAEDFAQRIAAGGLFLLAQADDEGIVGFVSFSAGEVVSLYVTPACTGHGVGKALLREVEVQARRHELPEVRLNSSLSARGFYEHLGYLETERVTYHTPSGIGVPCVRMVKRLGW